MRDLSEDGEDGMPWIGNHFGRAERRIDTDDEDLANPTKDCAALCCACAVLRTRQVRRGKPRERDGARQTSGPSAGVESEPENQSQSQSQRETVTAKRCADRSFRLRSSGSNADATMRQAADRHKKGGDKKEREGPAGLAWLRGAEETDGSGSGALVLWCFGLLCTASETSKRTRRNHFTPRQAQEQRSSG